MCTSNYSEQVNDPKRNSEYGNQSNEIVNREEIILENNHQ